MTTVVRCAPLALMLVVGFPGPAAPSTAAGETTVLLLGEQSHWAETEELAWVIRAQLAEVGVLLDVQMTLLPDDPEAPLELAVDASENKGALLVIWGCVDGAEKIFLYVDSEQGERLLCRSLAGTGQERAMRHDAIAAIVRSSAEAVLRGETIQGDEPVPMEMLSRPAAPRMEETVTSPESSGAESQVDTASSTVTEDSRAPFLSLDMRYELRWFSSAVRNTHGVHLAVGLGVGRRFYLVAGGGVRPRIIAEDEFAVLQATAGDIRLGVAKYWELPGAMLSHSVCLELTLYRWRVEAKSEDLQALPGAVDPALGLHLEPLGVALPIKEPLWIVGGFRLTVPLVNQAYDTEVGGDQRVLLAPWPFQPSLAVGLVFLSR